MAEPEQFTSSMHNIADEFICRVSLFEISTPTPRGLLKTQGRVVRRPVNVKPGLNVHLSIILSCLKMFVTSNVWCSLRLLQLKTEGQTM